MGTRLIALDLDGTLLNEKMHVSEKTRQVMELCAQRGIEIVPATGRALPAVPEEVLSLPGVHYGIFTNGAVVRDFGKNTWVSESCLSWEETIRVIEVLRRHPVIYDMYVSEGGVRRDCWHSWKNTGYRNVNAPISGRRAGQLLTWWSICGRKNARCRR